MSKNNLNAAFRALRKKGYFARQDFWCCQNCGWAAMTDEQAQKAVFYHRQDTQRLREDGTCYLAWSGDGNEIVQTLRDNGITVDWDGTDDTRIKITL